MTDHFYFLKGTKIIVQATAEKPKTSSMLPARAYFQKDNGELVRAKKFDGYYVKDKLIPVPNEAVVYS